MDEKIKVSVMKKDEIIQRVRECFKRIEKSFDKLRPHFFPLDILQFRTEIKQLRAFLHLLDMEATEGNQYKITQKMKTLYGYTGIIGNLHSLLQDVNSVFEYSTDPNVTSLINRLEHEIKYWEKTIQDFVAPHTGFGMDKENILSNLPERLRKRSVKKFVDYTVFEIQSLLTHFRDDEKIQTIRKFLEDIVYNWDVLDEGRSYLPKELYNESDIKEMIMILLEYKEKSASNILLQEYYEDAETDEQKVIIADVLNFCRAGKEKLRKRISSKLGLIPVPPIVRGSFSLK